LAIEVWILRLIVDNTFFWTIHSFFISCHKI